MDIYIFKQWKIVDENSNDEIVVDNPYTFAVDKNVILIPIFVEGYKYNVIFDGNGATSGEMQEQIFIYDTEGYLQENNFERDGYIFSGCKDGTGKRYVDKAEVKNLVDADNTTITLYAQWEKIEKNDNDDLNNRSVDNSYSWSTLDNSGGGSSGSTNSSSSSNQNLISENQTMNNETSQQTELKIPEQLKTRKYLIGYDDGKIKPENHVTRAEFATIIYRLMNNGEKVNLNNLERIADVKGTDWFGNAVAYLIDDSRKIINITEKKFRPQENIKGYEMMNIIHSVLKFYGVEQNSLYAQNLNSDITRAKMAEIIFNLLGRKSNLSQKNYSNLDKNHSQYKFLMDTAE